MAIAADTSPEADAAQVEAYRRMGGSRPVNPEQETLHRLVQVLERLGIPHMVTGSALGVLDLWREIAGETRG